LEVSQPIGEVLSLRLDASAWGDGDKNPVDLTEAYLEYRPYPLAGFKARIKAGAFYAPVSLENRAAGWESPYTLSSSALNTWVAEELRTVGVEAQIDWLGTRLGHAFDWSVVGGVFGWNDPAGVLIAKRGFTLNARQSTLFGRTDDRELFHEIDGRAGVYYGAEARYLDRVTVRALHYDNRADPTAYDEAIHDYAWETRFDSVGARVDLPEGWSAIFQWLQGETYIEPGLREFEWPFKARFALLSKRLGPHTLSARRDDFNVSGDGSQRGHAWTIAYVLEPNTHWRFVLEELRVRGRDRDDQLELSVRYAISSRQSR
jgi:hypothetical protein